MGGYLSRYLGMASYFNYLPRRIVYTDAGCYWALKYFVIAFLLHHFAEDLASQLDSFDLWNSALELDS